MVGCASPKFHPDERRAGLVKFGASFVKNYQPEGGPGDHDSSRRHDRVDGERSAGTALPQPFIDYKGVFRG
jgi:hypothetical protein